MTYFLLLDNIGEPLFFFTFFLERIKAEQRKICTFACNKFQKLFKYVFYCR